MGRWIEGHADHGEGRRILAELQRLAQGEGYLWAPSDGVLARMAFPRVQTFGSSRAPQRDESAAAPRMLAAVDLSAIAAALAEVEVGTVHERPEPALAGREHWSGGSGNRPRSRGSAGPGSQDGGGGGSMRVRLSHGEKQNASATSGGRAPE